MFVILKKITRHIRVRMLSSTKPLKPDIITLKVQSYLPFGGCVGRSILRVYTIFIFLSFIFYTDNLCPVLQNYTFTTFHTSNLFFY